MLDACGLEDWQIRIGHVGILKGALNGLGLSLESPDGSSEPPVATAMRFLDKGDDAGLAALLETNGIAASNAAPLRALADLSGGAETLEPARQILASLRGVSLEALDELQITLDAVAALAPAPPSLAVDLTVARGLDYYTGMVFEVIVPSMGGEGQVLGGGSYKLLHLFGLPDLDPCCGFGLGFDRVLLALEAQAAAAGRNEVVPGESSDKPLLAVIPFNVDIQAVLPIVGQLRRNGVRVELELRGRKIGKAMGWANSIGADYTYVVGPRDLEQGAGMLKSLSSGEQTAVALDAESIAESL